ncbi:Stress responsive alpha-beta barrel domain protein [Klebsormidium nitens]|uniref:Stress responsive alpha-beta barrel domain protein n=1 Tax=Klebsormidium nitens TaxID=105231 RepID=A0A1Y1I922_KLENI|nr:Stress responsive alpha-beta barrel domain protein [Klebsormidium nitens]|eukprot:GAQ85909.1 Stress responsive alpha-beta barrel domain protein [Klebsormidium nitens]
MAASMSRFAPLSGATQIRSIVSEPQARSKCTSSFLQIDGVCNLPALQASHSPGQRHKRSALRAKSQAGPRADWRAETKRRSHICHQCHQSCAQTQFGTARGYRRSAAFTTRASADGAEGGPTWDPPGGKRKVVEHVTLYQMRGDLTEEAEKEMLDHLWSLQYKFREMLATSVGRIYSKRSGGFTHALYARFPNMESAENYEYSPASLAVLQSYVQPLCEDSLSVSFEANVENDVEAIFRRGDHWNEGVEHVVLLKVKEGTPQESVTSLLTDMEDLQAAAAPNVVQLTIGSNVSSRSKGYTHAMVVRCPSEDDLAAYNKHPKHRDILRKKVLPNCGSLLAVDYSIDPIGERLM